VHGPTECTPASTTRTLIRSDARRRPQSAASRLRRHHLREYGDDPRRRWLLIAVVAGDFNEPKKSAPDKNPTADKVIAFCNGIGR
jgi:hypothetical protein